MSYQLEVLPQASKQIDEAFIWYEEKKAGLGYDFIEKIEKCFLSITLHPFMYGQLPERPKYRKILTTKFPYTVIFKVKKNMVIVYSVVHDKRKKKI